MKEAFERILERLEEDCWLTTNDDGETNELSIRVVSLEDANKIVQEVAEEFATDTNVGNNGWIACSERLPDNDKKEYIVQKTNGFIYILGFTKDAYKLSRYDFAEYKGKKKQLFYDYDSEYGYIEWECEAYQPLPELFKESD